MVPKIFYQVPSVESPPKNCDEKIMIHHHEVLVVNDVLNDPK